MKPIIYAIAVSSILILSCSEPEELTPKVDDVTNNYLIPTGTILNVQDREEVQKLWDEYNAAINQ